MNYEKFVLDLPLQRRISFSSIEESQEVMKQDYNVDQHILQLSPGPFRSDLIVNNIGDIDLFSDRFSTAFSMTLVAPENMVGFIFLNTPGNKMNVSGEKVENDKLLFMPPKSVADIISLDMVGSETITMPYTRFMGIAEAICPAPKSMLPNKTRAIIGNTEKLNVFRKAFHNLTIHPELKTRNELLSNLIAELIVWMCLSSNQWREEKLLVKKSKQRLAKRTREYFEENYSRTVKMDDVCHEMGVGLRTMQRAFTEYFQITPYNYLKLVRLNKVRNELIARKTNQHTITEIAQGYGFTHSGRFSKDYREMFGELPSATIKQINEI